MWYSTCWHAASSGKPPLQLLIFYCFYTGHHRKACGDVNARLSAWSLGTSSKPWFQPSYLTPDRYLCLICFLLHQHSLWSLPVPPYPFRSQLAPQSNTIREAMENTVFQTVKVQELCGIQDSHHHINRLLRKDPPPTFICHHYHKNGACIYENKEIYVYIVWGKPCEKIYESN